jgi:hypothetical protein
MMAPAISITVLVFNTGKSRLTERRDWWFWAGGALTRPTLRILACPALSAMAVLAELARPGG